MAATLALAPAHSDTAWPAVRWAIVRDVKLALRSRAELGVQLLFYVLVASLFPLAMSPSA
jgi:ABC-type transport system involved in cytochrome c biogenesis permease component